LSWPFFLLASNIFYVFVVPRPDWGLVAIALVAACFLIYVGLAMRLYFRKSYRNDQRFRLEFTAEIANTGIEVTAPLAKSQMTWNIFVRVLESERKFMLFVAPWQFLIFPKRYLTSNQIEQLQTLLRSHNINVEPSE
jgi:YcxB-like protein